MTTSFKAFTAKASGLLSVLQSEVYISGFMQRRTDTYSPPLDEQRFVAIWDTGATNTVVTQQVVTTIGLQQISITTVHTVNASRESAVYYATIYLPNRIVVPNIRVTEGDIYGADVLIGMDIIALGDFAITNVSRETVFSFRIPSLACIDYVKEAELFNQKQEKKNNRKQRRPPSSRHPATRK